MMHLQEDICRYCSEKYTQLLKEAMSACTRVGIDIRCTFDLNKAILYLNRIYDSCGADDYETAAGVSVPDYMIQITYDCYIATFKFVTEVPIIRKNPFSNEFAVDICKMMGPNQTRTNYEIADTIKEIKRALVDAVILIEAWRSQNAGVNRAHINEEFHERCEDARKAQKKCDKNQNNSLDISSIDRRNKAAIKKAVNENAKKYIAMMGKVTRLFKHGRYEKLIEWHRQLGEDYAMNVIREVDKLRDSMYITIIPYVADEVRTMIAATNVCSSTTKIPYDSLVSLTKLQAISCIFGKSKNPISDGLTPAKLEATAKMVEPIVDALRTIVSTGFISSVISEATKLTTTSGSAVGITEDVNDDWVPDMEKPKSKVVYEDTGDIFTEASLSESFIFNKLNDSSTITKRIADILNTGNVVERSFIEEQYSQISKTHLSPLSGKVLDAFDRDDVMLIYNKSAHLTVAVPFIVMQFKGKFRSLIFISDFSSINRDGTALNIEMKKLYTLMESAYVGLHFYTNPTPYQRSSVIAKLTASIYAEMGLRIMNKEFALSLNKNSYDMVNYSMARFYLAKVFGMASAEVIDSYARGTCKSPDNTTMGTVKAMYDDEPVETLEDLLKFFVKCNPKMERLTFRYYLERWISSYMMGSTLAMDNFPYLYYVILSVLLGSFMVNNQALNDPIKNMKGMQHFHGEIARVTP